MTPVTARIDGQEFEFAHEGEVLATFVYQPDQDPAVRKEQRLPSAETAELLVEVGHGVFGDHHAGGRSSDIRELRTYGIPRKTRVANCREFSAVSEEDLIEIRRLLRLPEPVPFGALNENLVLAGFPQLACLPPGSTLHFWDRDGTKRDAVLAVWGENRPCPHPGKVLQKHFFPDMPDLPKAFDDLKRWPVGVRGIVGFVLASGAIARGDTVRVLLPDPR